MTQTRLQYVSRVNPPSPAFDRLGSEDDLTFLPMENVWPGERLNLSQIRVKSAVVSGYTRFQDGDLLLPKITPTFEASRSVIVAGLLNGVGAGTTELHVLRPGPEVEPRFLLYVTHSLPFLKLGEAEMYGVAGQKRVPDRFVRDFPLLLPPLEEQRRIADYLDAETERIGGLEKAYRHVRRALLKRRSAEVWHLITGGGDDDLAPASLPWVWRIPRRWSAVKISYLARVGSGHTPSRAKSEYWADCTIPWITTGEVSQVRDDRLEVITETREKISELGMANSAAELHPAGTVVLCRTANSAGYSAVMGEPMATSQDLVTWTCGPRLDPFYLLWCLRAMRSDLLGRLAMGSTHKTIYFPDLQGLRIPCPPLDEQQAIVASIRESNERIDALIDSIDRQLELLGERRRASITAAVTGQFDVSTAGAGRYG